MVGVSEGGIGFSTSALLAQRGCKVVLLGRSLGRLRAAQKSLEASVPGVKSSLYAIDLTNFSSVSETAEQVSSKQFVFLLLLLTLCGKLLADLQTIEILVLNAGTMTEGALTVDGWNGISQVCFDSPSFFALIFLSGESSVAVQARAASSSFSHSRAGAACPCCCGGKRCSVDGP